jgi:MFS family permease
LRTSGSVDIVRPTESENAFMQTTNFQSSHSLTRADLRTLGLASIGGALEFYDFIIFVFFITVIEKLFFAAGQPDWIRQVQTFGIFAAGYLARPLGGLVMAHFGDKYGRKRIFMLSVLLMAFPTLLIGCLPTYQSIGAAAPLLLLLMRVLQGAAIGGEAPGAWVFVAEHAQRERVGFAIGLMSCGLSSGILLGSMMATGMNLVFTPAQMLSGAWRIPFLVGGVFGFIAIWLRRWLEETPVFEEMKRRAGLSRQLPLRIVIGSHGKAIVASLVSTWMLTAAIVVVVLMTPTLLQELFGLTPVQAQTTNLATTAALCVSTVAAGAASDRFGVRRVAVFMLLLLIASTCALYMTAGQMPSLLLPLSVLAGIGTGGIVATPIMMVRSFPDAVRFSGVSFSYNLAYAVFGGLTPLLVLSLADINRVGPACYVAVAVIGGLCAILAAPMNYLNRPPNAETT